MCRQENHMEKGCKAAGKAEAIWGREKEEKARHKKETGK